LHLACGPDHGLLDGYFGEIGVRQTKVEGYAGNGQKQLVCPQLPQYDFGCWAGQGLALVAQQPAGRDQGDTRLAAQRIDH